MKRDKNIIGLIGTHIYKKICKAKSSIKNRYMIFYDRMQQFSEDTLENEWQDLAPDDNIENGDKYFKSLEWAMKNEKIHNIALTGPYGSGKSSIIQSFLKKRPGIKYINISLASFLEEKDTKEGERERVLVGEEDEKLEEDILKQLFYKVDYKKIPQSRYRKLHFISQKSVFFIVLFILALSCFSILFFSPNCKDYLLELVNNSANNYRMQLNMAWGISLLLILAVVEVFSYVIWLIISKFKIRELGISDKALFAMEKEEDASIFNKYIDEILYFFEVMKYDAVFVEDLDRFESTRIFIKLRELNGLLNNYERIKKKITFIYAVKDDMFADKDRTKFFDFIIPVIPYINSTNSHELLKKKINKSKLKINISEDYITQISGYIDDMRILKNIFNEFIIYKSTLSDNQNLKLRDEQLMSVVILKNLYPNEFSKLQNEEGVFKEAFTCKSKFIDYKKKELSEDIEGMKDILNNIAKDTLKNIRELKAAMLFLASDGYAIKKIQINGTSYTHHQILDDNFDMYKLKNGEIEFTCKTSGGEYKFFFYRNIDELNDKLENKTGLIERFDYIKNSIASRQEKIRKEIESQNILYEELSTKKIRDLIKLYGSIEVLSSNVQKNKLFVFLLENGFIDENYANYINYFHPESLNICDMNFILGIRNHDKISFFNELDKKAHIVKNLLPHEFEQKEIYNIFILDYLLEKERNSEKCNRFLKQLSDGNQLSMDFIDAYVNHQKNLPVFINDFSRVCPQYWALIYSDVAVSASKKFQIFKNIIMYADVDDIVKMNLCTYKDGKEEYGSMIEKYFLENSDILQKLSDVDVIKIENIIEEIEMEFSSVNIEGVNDSILEFIFANRYYKINYEMIENVIKFKIPACLEDLSVSNYTQIKKTQYAPLIDYIEENFEEYLDKVCLALDTNTKEEGAVILEILLKKIDSKEICNMLLEKEEHVFSSFRNCCFELIQTHTENVKYIWEKLLVLTKIVISWKNIMEFYINFGISDALLTFVNVHLSDLIIQDDKKEIVSQDFIKEYMYQNHNMKSYQLFFSNFELLNMDIDFNNLDEAQLDVLIACKTIKLSSDVFNSMKATYPQMGAKYLLSYKEQFFKDIDQYEINIRDIELLCDSFNITHREVWRLVQKVEVDDITLSIAQRISGLEFGISKAVVEKAWGLLSYDERKTLLLYQLNLYSNDELSTKFMELGREYEQLVDRSKVRKITMHYSDYNEALFEKLKFQGYLTSYHTEIEKETILNMNYPLEKILIGRVKKKS